MNVMYGEALSCTFTHAVASTTTMFAPKLLHLPLLSYGNHCHSSRIAFVHSAIF